MKEEIRSLCIKVEKSLKRKIQIYCAERGIKQKEFILKALISELKK